MRAVLSRLAIPAAVMGSLLARAEQLPISPTTQPANAVATPATRPAPPLVPASIPAGGAKLLLLPFTGVDATDRRDWISRGVLSSLQGDLSRLTAVQPVTLDTGKPENAPPETGYDTDTVVKLGRAVGARYAIFGTYQTIDPELRLVGVILDVTSGQPVGGMKATGTLRDIFGMEDSLGSQAKRQLQQATVAVRLTPPAVPSVPPGAPPQNASDNGPVRNPFPAVAFDDDAARQSIDRLRYRDDWDFPYSPYPTTFFGFGPVFGFGWGTRSYYRSPRSSAAPVTTPVERSPASTHTAFRGQVGSGNPIFRGGGYLDTPARVIPTRMVALTTADASLTAGHFAWPTPQTVGASRVGGQAGGSARSAGQIGIRTTPTVTPVPAGGSRGSTTVTEGFYSGR